MANTLLTPTIITREALMVLHEKLAFVGSINRQYDKQFANSGASPSGKIGPNLTIRMPNEYTVRTGKVMDVQDQTEQSQVLTVSTQKGVDMNFDSQELTLTIDEFSKRYIRPAMTVLAAHIEADALSMYKDVHTEVSDVGATATTALVLDVARFLTDNLAPVSDRSLLLSTQMNANLVSVLSTLRNDPTKVSQQYREGLVANNFLGFENVYQTTLAKTHTTGTDDGTGDYLTNQATLAEGATSTVVDTGAGTWKKGDIFYFESGVNRVHPETKETTGRRHPFVVTADAGANATSISFSPAIYSTGPRQNVLAMPGNSTALSKIEYDLSTAIGNAADYVVGLGYHKDAFAIAFADLFMPKGVDFAARQVVDDISMRIVRQYDINNDKYPCRIDVLYGYKTIRPQLACRLGLN